MTDVTHDYQDNESYSYDDNGNRTNNGYVTGDNNQLLSDGTHNYEYDNEGNRVKKTEIATGDVTEYEWDYRNRLVDVETKDSDGNVIANSDYTYDVFDNRIGKSVDADGDGAGEAVVERYVLDDDHIALTFDGDGNQTERFLHGLQIDQVLAQENENGEVLWGLSDHLGSTRLVLDSDGAVVNNITYDSFGNVTVETNDSVNFRFLYTGRESDSETGLNYNRGRYYDPITGRFVSIDPIGFAAGDSNLYRYVGNNPLFYLDPSGFCGVGSSGNNNSDGDKDFWEDLSDLFIPAAAASTPPPGADSDLDSSGNEDIKVADSTTIREAKCGIVCSIVVGAGALGVWAKEKIFGSDQDNDGFDEFDQQHPVEQQIEKAAKDRERLLEDLIKQSQPSAIDKNDPQEFDPNNINIDIYKAPTDPFNVETFPGQTYNNDDFSNGDVFTFPDRNITLDLNKPIPDFDDDIRDILTDVFDINLWDTGKNAKQLRRNMIDEGIIFNPGDNAHHIVPSTDSRTQEARELRETLEDFNIDINDAVNGVPLSGKQHHGQGLHSKDNYREINRRLQEATNRQEARDVLQQIGNEMKNGTYTFPKN